jgi:hypothetical protein
MYYIAAYFPKDDRSWKDHPDRRGVRMLIKIYIEGKLADEELRSLYGWLLQESTIRQNAKIDLAPEGPGEGQMGNTLDLITLAVSGTLQLPPFIQTLVNWRQTRRREYPVTIEIDGNRVILPKADDDLIMKVIKELNGDD